MCSIALAPTTHAHLPTLPVPNSSRPCPAPQQVFFYRKAQLLAAQLHLRFRGSDPRFQFADMAELAADSGELLQLGLRCVDRLKAVRALVRCAACWVLQTWLS